MSESTSRIVTREEEIISPTYEYAKVRRSRPFMSKYEFAALLCRIDELKRNMSSLEEGKTEKERFVAELRNKTCPLMIVRTYGNQKELWHTNELEIPEAFLSDD